jgi:putative ATPase
LPLAEATIYIATAHKSNSVIRAVDAALKEVRENPTLAVPKHLRDSHYRGAERLGHGKGYEYAHDHPEHFVAQDYLGAVRRFYEPTTQGTERKIKDRLEHWRSMMEKARQEKDS